MSQDEPEPRAQAEAGSPEPRASAGPLRQGEAGDVKPERPPLLEYRSQLQWPWSLGQERHNGLIRAARVWRRLRGVIWGLVLVLIVLAVIAGC